MSKRRFVLGLTGILVALSGASAWAKSEEEQARNTFFEIEPVVVNLAAPDTNRYLQVAMSYEITDTEAFETMKTYLPIIRSRALLVLSTKTADEVLSIDGKQLLLMQLLDAARFTLSEKVSDADRRIQDIHLTSIVVQ